MLDNVKNERMVQFRNPGVLQWPMSVAQQKKAGLIASVNRSIHPRHWAKAQAAKQYEEK